MQPFEYVHAASLGEASELLGDKSRRVRAKAGGIDLLDLMKEGLERPDRLVHLRRIPDLGRVQETAQGVRLGALLTLAELAANETVRRLYPGLANAAAEAATPQIRNVATVAGNLCQRNRCWYFRAADFPCLRKGGEVCFAEKGENRYHAIFSDSFCYAVHPSNLAPMLIALDAAVEIYGPNGARTLMLAEGFFRIEGLEGRDVTIGPQEIITAVVIPAAALGLRTAYLEVRERRSFDWALVSASVALRMEGKVCREARIVLGSVAPLPWRAHAAEEKVRGKALTLEVAEAAADAALADAKPLADNGYKVPVAKAVLWRALIKAAQ
ncbi:MAG: FAD binding domain-containing protein [Planctomycetota bacterium]